MTPNDFEQYAHQYSRALFSYCLSCTCDPHQAEELAQETLTRAFQKRDSLREPDAFFAWMKGIAKRCWWSWWRKPKTTSLSQTTAKPTGEAAGTDPTPSENAYQQEKEVLVLSAIKKLSMKHRETIVLRYFEDLSYAEIAARLSISVDAVDQRLTRARLQLKKRLHLLDI